MKVKDFIAMEKSGAMVIVVDASKPGYMTRGERIIEADRNVVCERFGDATLVGFEPKGKKVVVYIK